MAGHWLRHAIAMQGEPGPPPWRIMPPAPQPTPSSKNGALERRPVLDQWPLLLVCRLCAYTRRRLGQVAGPMPRPLSSPRPRFGVPLSEDSFEIVSSHGGEDCRSCELTVDASVFVPLSGSWGCTWCTGKDLRCHHGEGDGSNWWLVQHRRWRCCRHVPLHDTLRRLFAVISAWVRELGTLHQCLAPVLFAFRVR